MKANEAFKELVQLNDKIERLLQMFGDECDNIHRNEDDLDELFLRDQIYFISVNLEKVQRMINYLQKQVRDQGVLRKNSAGRYELPNGDYLTSGSTCEILDPKYNEWTYTSIEHGNGDYYATALGRDMSIDGLIARIRR